MSQANWRAFERGMGFATFLAIGFALGYWRAGGSFWWP